MKFSRTLISGVLALALLLFCAADSQNALTNEMIGIESLLKRVEQRVSGARQFAFGDRDIQNVLSRMKRLSAHLEEASAKGPSRVVTDVSSRYLTALGEVYILYARVAHSTGQFSSSFDYDTLNAYDLKLHDAAARPLIVQKPFNARHSSGDVVEFFITSEEKQMAEFLALSQASDEYTYEKLLQFVSVRQEFVNLWALQRVSYSTIPTQPVNSCAPALLSFRVRNGNLKSSETYNALLALDRYNSLTSRLDPAYAVTHDFTLASAADYYSAMSHLFAPTPEFQSYTQGIDPRKVSQWLQGAAQKVSDTEKQDWQSDAENAKKILDSSTLISDDLHSYSIAGRMAAAVAERHEQSAAAEIESVAVNNLKMKDSPELRAKIDAELNRYVVGAAKALAPKLLPALSSIDNSTSSDKEIYDRIQAKVSELLPTAEKLMPAEHDEQMISEAGAITDDPATAKATQYSKAPLVYVRDQFQFVISDTTTFKGHLMGELEQNGSLWKKLQATPSASKGLSRFLQNVDRGMAAKLAANPNATTAQLSWDILAVAKAAAAQTLSSLSGDWQAQQLLAKAFETIDLQNAKSPSDLAPTTESQRDLVESAISQGYETNPLLGVKWKRSGWFQMKETLLERLYEEAYSQNQLQPAATNRLVLEALQSAVQSQQGKLEDFCQANLGNPKDPRFKNMFLSATHLRKILTSDPADPSLGAKLKKFDDDLTTKTESRSEVLLNKYVDPVLTVVFVATLVILAVSLFAPVGIAGALTVLVAVLNYGVMAPLTGADLYLRTSVDFFQKPAQLAYQDAIASSQISGQDPYSDWETLKKQGFVSNTTDRVTVEQNHRALTNSQLMTIAAVPMDIWYGQSIYSGIRSATGATGLAKIRSLFNGQVPAFAEIARKPKARPFMQALHEDGFGSAVQEQVGVAAENAKINIKAVAGIAPVYGKYTSEEAAQALRVALAREMPEDVQSILPELGDYVDFLKARLTTSTALSNAVLDDSPFTTLRLSEEVPRGLPLDEAPELKGRLSWSEAMANPELRKFVLIPKSAFAALREGRIVEWFSEYGSIVREINGLRGRLIAAKIADFEALEEKLAQAASTGASPSDTIASLSDKDLSLLEEAAKGPQWLTYGYWSAKLAQMSRSETPLGSLLSVFQDYQEMLRSLRPINWSPGFQAVAPENASQQDLRNFYRKARGQDGILIQGATSDDAQARQLEERIEGRLYPPRN